MNTHYENGKIKAKKEIQNKIEYSFLKNSERPEEINYKGFLIQFYKSNGYTTIFDKKLKLVKTFNLSTIDKAKDWIDKKQK